MANYKGIRPLRLWAVVMLAWGAISISTTTQAQTQEGPVLNPDVPLKYVVKPGDTLWGIAAYYLRDPWLWPELWNVNPQVSNPHLIFPGDVLYLVQVDGKYRLQRNPQEASRLQRLTPQIRRSPLEAAIPTIPLNEIRAFLQGPRVIDRKTYEKAPHIIAFGDGRLLGSEEGEAYVRGVDKRDGYAYSIVRIGKQYRDPDTGDILGYEAIPVGDASVETFEDVSRAHLTSSDREARKLDRLLPANYSDFRADFFPSAPEQEIQGHIIAVYDGVSQIGQYQIVTLNRGTQQGLQPGHVLRIKQTGKKVKDPKAWALAPKVRLPDVDAGHLMVFKTFERLSYALIMLATRPIHVLDKVENPTPGT